MGSPLSRMTVRVSLQRPFYLGNDGDDGGPASACQGCTKGGGAISICNTESKTRRFYSSYVGWYIEEFGILRNIMCRPKYYCDLHALDLCKYIVLV